MKVPDTDTAKIGLPSWVKCMTCGGKPTKGDWLMEVIPNSNALIHQSCAAKKGKFAGLNAGTIQGDLK